MSQPLSGHQRGARARNYHPCEQCTHDQKRCELPRAAPCVRCAGRGWDCTVGGKTKEQYLQLLAQRNGGQNPYLFPRQEGDGFLALLSDADRGIVCLQHVTLHFAAIGPSIRVDPNILEAINSNQDAILREMLDQVNGMYNSI